jgi:tetrahydromethanopterin S-methyltransferase subunit G
MLLLIMQTPIGSKNSLTELKNLILISYDTIIYEYSQLLQFKIEGSEEYFGLIEQQIKKLKIFIDHLKELNIEKVENKIKSIIFINDNFENIKYPIEKIYEIRGMFSNLMSILLKIRENQISNFKKMEQTRWSENENNRVKLIEEKEKKITLVKNQINGEIQEALQELASKKQDITEHSEKITEDKKNYLSKNISEQFNNLNEKLKNRIDELNEIVNNSYREYYNRFGKLSEKIKKDYNLLKSNMTKLLFEKFYQELLKISPGVDLFDKFQVIADLYFIDVLEELNPHEIEPILEKFCEIHDNLKT